MSPEAKKINLMLSIAGMHHGGAERVIACLCRNLDPERYAITVCWRASRGDIGEELREQGFEVVGLPEVKPGVSPYTRFLVLRKLLKDLQIDVIHTHDTGALADAVQCRMLGSRAKIVHTFHFGNYPNLKTTYLNMERVFSRFAHRLIAVGYEQAKLIRRTLHLSGSRLSTIYNGVESAAAGSEPAAVSSLADLPGDAVVLGSISTLTEQKGLFILLDAAAILRDKGANWVLLIAGGGPLKDELEKKVRDLGLTDQVRFLGWVEKAAENILPSLDVFCQSSLWEANSIVLLEAMAAGIAIVTTDVGESRHVIDQGRGGLVVPSGDAVALAEALAGLVDDREKRRSMGKRAQEKFGSNYTVDNMVRNYAEVYEPLSGK